jgi:hypothetical protein
MEASAEGPKGVEHSVELAAAEEKCTAESVARSGSGGGLFNLLALLLRNGRSSGQRQAESNAADRRVISYADLSYSITGLVISTIARTATATTSSATRATATALEELMLAPMFGHHAWRSQLMGVHTVSAMISSRPRSILSMAAMMIC